MEVSRGLDGVERGADVVEGDVGRIGALGHVGGDAPGDGGSGDIEEDVHWADGVEGLDGDEKDAEGDFWWCHDVEWVDWKCRWLKGWYGCFFVTLWAKTCCRQQDVSFLCPPRSMPLPWWTSI